MVRVRHEAPSGPASSCVDVLPQEIESGADIYEDQLVFSVGGASLSAGRCAGPRPLDLTRALPLRLLPLKSVARRARVVDLSGRFSFVAGPFRGQVVSSVKATVRRRSAPSDSIFGSSFTERFDSGPKRRYAVLRLRYRVSPASGTLLTSFRGRPRPACVALGACGARGSSALEVSAQGGSIDVYGWRRQSGGPARKDALLRALRRGGLPIQADARLSRPASQVRQVVTVGDGAACSDALFVLPPEFFVRRQRRAPRLSVYLNPSDFSSASDSLRARCPGPSASDVLPGPVLARGGIALSDLGQPSLPVLLKPTAAAFMAGGYAGERSGGMPLALRLTKSEVGIERF